MGGLQKVKSIMEERKRRFSTVQQINPETLKAIGRNANRLDVIDDVEEGDRSSEAGGTIVGVHGTHGHGHRKQSLQHKLTSTLGECLFLSVK